MTKITTNLGLFLVISAVQCYFGADFSFYFNLVAPGDSNVKHRPNSSSMMPLGGVAMKELSGKQILAIDDNPEILEVLEIILTRAGADVRLANSSEAGLRQLSQVQFDLVLLDLCMPVTDGWQTLSTIHSVCDVPVILLTAESRNRQVVRGLEAGAVDYILKPFNHEIFIARIRNALRNTTAPSQLNAIKQYDDGYLRVDLHNHTLSVANRPITLTAKEWKLLVYFFQSSSRLLTFDQLLENVWGWEYSGSTQYVHVLVSRLRRKIEQNPKRPAYLFTERGVGYRFSLPGSPRNNSSSPKLE